MSHYFVAGSHTDVGKTFVSCQLIRARRAAGRSATAFKPVLSGFDPERPEASDAGELLKALGEPVTSISLDRISPLRFIAPLAPPSAARLEGVLVTRDRLLTLSSAWLSRTDADLNLLEGAGGVMSPIAEDATNLDLMTGLGLPVLLVGGSYLGSISHTLTALDVLRTRSLTIAAVVVSQSADPEAPDFAETVELTRQHAGGVPIFAAPRNGHAAWASALTEALAAQRR